MAVRDDFQVGEVLKSEDLNDTFGAKAPLASPTFTGTVTIPDVNLGAWTTFTPTFNGVVIGNGTLSSRYQRTGKLVVVSVVWTLGSTSSVTGPTDIVLPFTARSQNSLIPWGVAYYYDSTGASVLSIGGVIYVGTTAGRFITTLTNTSFASQAEVNSTSPFTWTTGDVLMGQFMYEAA